MERDLPGIFAGVWLGKWDLLLPGRDADHQRVIGHPVRFDIEEPIVPTRLNRLGLHEGFEGFRHLRGFRSLFRATRTVLRQEVRDIILCHRLVRPSDSVAPLLDPDSVCGGQIGQVASDERFVLPTELHLVSPDHDQGSQRRLRGLTRPGSGLRRSMPRMSPQRGDPDQKSSQSDYNAFHGEFPLADSQYSLRNEHMDVVQE